MLDALGAEMKKIMLAGIGAVALTTEKAKDLVDDLVKKGEITVEQGKVLNEELKRSTKEKINKHVTVNVVNEFKDVFSAVDKMSREELDALKEKLNEMAAKTAEEAAEEKAEADAEAAEDEGCGCGCEEKECSEDAACKCDGENCDNK